MEPPDYLLDNHYDNGGPIRHHHHVFVINDDGEFDHYLDGAFFHDHDNRIHYEHRAYFYVHEFGDNDHDSRFDIDDSTCDDDCPWRSHDDNGVEYFDAAVHRPR